MAFQHLSHIILAVIFLTSATGNKFNVSLSDLTTCDIYNIPNKGYTYADFFELSSLKNHKVNESQRLHLKFYVMSSMDAHILLSEVKNPSDHDRVYEIVLGAGSNTFSAIRIQMTGHRVETALATDLLSVFDPMPVEIIQNKDGLLVVNIANYSKPHLKYKDKSPLNIKYVSFSSHGETAAKWYYDCGFDGFFEEMTMEERPLTNEERLSDDILNVTDSEVPPPGVNEIKFSFKVRSVEFDLRSSVLSTRLYLMMDWKDSRLKWNASEYGGVNFIKQPLFKIWHPILIVRDGSLDTKKLHPFYSIRIDSDGQVRMFARNAVIHSSCFNVTEDWRNDFINCVIILETNNRNIKLAYDTSTPLTDQNMNKLSKWKISNISVAYAKYVRQGNTTVSSITEKVADELTMEMTIIGKKVMSAIYSF